jgi:hypothetical protein
MNTMIATIYTMILIVGLAGLTSTRNAIAQEPYSVDWDHYKAAWEADEANQLKQSEKDYLDWVAKFYNGVKVLGVEVTPSWTKETKLIVAKYDSKHQKTIRDRLLATGQSICTEWAKDNSVRLIDTDDLKDWSKKINSANEADDGSGELLLEELSQVNSQISKMLEQNHTS